MAHRYASWSASQRTRDMGVHAWVAKYGAGLGGDYRVACLMPDGTLGSCLMSEAAIVFQRLEVLSSGNRQRRQRGRGPKERGSRWVTGVPQLFRPRPPHAKPAPPVAPVTPAAKRSREATAPTSAAAALPAPSERWVDLDDTDMGALGTTDGPDGDESKGSVSDQPDSSTGLPPISGDVAERTPGGSPAANPAAAKVTTCFVKAQCARGDGHAAVGWAWYIDGEGEAYRDAFEPVGHRSALMQLGLAQTPQHATLFRQSARNFLSAGRNEGEMSDGGVVIAYMCAFKELLFRFADARTAEARDALAHALVAMRLTMAAYFRTMPDSRQFWEPILQDASAFDMLQRVAAFCFTEEPMDDETRLRILEVTLKRMRRRVSAPLDLLTHNLAGPIAVLFAVPLLRAIDTPAKVAALVRQFNAKSMDLLVCLTQVMDTDDVTVRGNLVLAKLAELGGVPSVDGRLLAWCNDPANLHVEAPLEEWGAIATPDLPFHVGRANVRVKATSDVLARVKVTTGADGVVSLVSPAPTEWNAVTLRDPGTYTLRAELVGSASRGRGNTANKEKTANLRFTTAAPTGAVVFPDDRPGWSAAGREFKLDARPPRERRFEGAGWNRDGGRRYRHDRHGYGGSSWRGDGGRGYDSRGYGGDGDWYDTHEYRGFNSAAHKRPRRAQPPRRYRFVDSLRCLDVTRPFTAVVQGASSDSPRQLTISQATHTASRAVTLYSTSVAAGDDVVLAFKWMNVSVHFSEPTPVGVGAGVGARAGQRADAMDLDEPEAEDATPSVQQLMAQLQALKKQEVRAQTTVSAMVADA